MKNEETKLWLVVCWMHEWFDFYPKIDSVWDNDEKAKARAEKLREEKTGKRSKESGKGTLEEVEILCIPLNNATMFLKKEEDEEEVF